MSQHDGITPPARPLVSFTPMNMQEHENDIRAIVNTHQGFGGGNPSQWVIKAGLECFSRGFGEGYAAAQAQARKAAPPMQQAATALFPHEERRLIEARDIAASPKRLEFVETQPGAHKMRVDYPDERGAQWLTFFQVALTGTAGMAGSADNVVNFAREIADTALQAWRER